MGLSPPNKTECWGADHEAGRMGPLMGKWGLSPRFLLFFFSPLLSYTETYFSDPFFSFFPPLSLIHPRSTILFL